MHVLETILAITTATAAIAAALLTIAMLRRDMHRWIFAYLLERSRRGVPGQNEEVHLILCIADHFEPHNGGASDERADRRVQAWLRDYPRVVGEFRDSDGRPPRHTFFYPMEQYNREHLDALATLCGAGFGEVEVHLHHDHDTPENLRRSLIEYKEKIAERHGLLARRRHSQELVYAFVHGDWALDNSRPDGRNCGINNELDILRETGCYADFTLPSAPSPTQTRQINSIYYAVDDPLKPKSHNHGARVGYGAAPDRALMLIQGPLLLNWRERRFGLFPKIENACIQSKQAATARRIDLWLKARVQVPARPDWFFVKLHTHGAPEGNQRVLLGDPMREFHQALAARARQNARFHFHYVTAREMYNLVRAAEAGWRGTVADARDFELVLERRTAEVSAIST